MRPAVALAGVFLLLHGALPRAQAPGPALWAGLVPGAHTVGFSTTLEVDPSRQLDAGPRPVQVSCWFPSAPGGTPLTFRDYFLLSASERGAATAEAKAAAVAAEKAFFASVGVDGARVDRWLDLPVYARAGAPPLAAAVPLVLVAQGNGQSAHHQAVLAELLASRGFLVCTTPSQVRLGDEMTQEADVLPGAVAQAADLAIAERSARARFRTRPDRVALVGHSFGARSALLYAARHGASAIVSLDGGIGAADARTWVDGAALDRTRVTTRILHIFEEGDRAITPDFGLIKSLTKADRTLIRIDGIRHIDFTSLGFGAAAIDGLTGPAPVSLAAKVRAAADLAAQFLAYSATAPFSPAAPAVPWIHVDSLPAAR